VCLVCILHSVALTEGVITLKGLSPMIDEAITMTADTPTANISNPSLRNSVRDALRQYFIRLEDQEPADLYAMVLAQVEEPMLEMVLQYTGQNQSKAAKHLRISRGTLRKKMAQYGLFKNKAND